MGKNLFIALLLCSGSVFSQEVLTFADCLERAMTSNPSLKSAAYDEKIAVVQHRASFGQYLPVVVADGENRNSWGKEIDSDTNLFVNDNIRNYEGTLNATFNLFSGFLAYNTIKAEKQEKELTRANIQQLRNQVTMDLATRFITILYLQEIIAANESQIQSSAKQLEMAELKFSSGYIAESEVFKIKSQKATEEFNLLNNQNRLAENMISMKQLMDMPLDAELVLMKPELELNTNVVEDADSFSIAEKAVDIHPAFKASLLSQKRARTELAIARAERLPKLSMRLMYRSNYNPEDEINSFDLQVDENTSKQIRFYLTIPIFNQFSTHSKIKTSKFLYRQSIIDTKIERQRLSKEVLLAINNAKTSLKKNEASASAFDFSQKSFDADALKFELGKININELNTSKIIYNNTQAELIQSKYELLFNNALIRFYMGEQFTL